MACEPSTPASIASSRRSRRTFAIPQRVIGELAGHLERTGRMSPDELVLQAANGGPVRATNFRLRIYGPAVRRAGLEGLTFHRLRHSAGHMLRELGVPLEVIQQRLGHASIRTTADSTAPCPSASTGPWPTDSTSCSVPDVVQMWCSRRMPTPDPDQSAADQDLHVVEVSGIEPPTSTLRT